MIYTIILLIFFGICLIHGLCRAFYNTGFHRGYETGKEDGQVNIVMIQAGLNQFRFIPDPLQKERSEKIINDILSSCQVRTADNSNPFFI